MRSRAHGFRLILKLMLPQMEHEFQVVKLHDFPDLIQPAAHLLNSEWPRSLTARCHYLESSSDDLPCSLLLLQGPGVSKVVGHSRLSRVLNKPKSVLVESVIVDKTLRRCGLGRKIMEHTEKFAQELGCGTIYLSTHGKQMFYAHLGYTNSVAVSAERKVTKFLFIDQKVKCDENQKRKHVILDESCANTDCFTLGHDVVEQGDVLSNYQDTSQLQPVLSEQSSPLPLLPSLLLLLDSPPPPPPKPPPLLTAPLQLASQKTPTEINYIGDGRNTRTIWMKKEL